MSPFADNDPQDELEYEPFDDVEWTDPDTLDAIDLDSVDEPPDDEMAEAKPSDDESTAPEPAASSTAQPQPVPQPTPPRRTSSHRPPLKPETAASEPGLSSAEPHTPPDENSADPADSATPARAALETEPTSPIAPSTTPDAVSTDEPVTTAEAPATEQPELAPDDQPAAPAASAVTPTADMSEPEPAPAATEPTAEVTDSTESVTKPAPAPAPEIAPVASAADQPAPAPAAAQSADEAEPVIPPDVYCVLLAMPPEISAEIENLRTIGEIITMPPPGIILSPQFRTMDIDPVQAALADWTRTHLPMQIEVTGIGAHIVGAQQYVAAWPVEPVEELQEALHALRLALAPLILPIAGTSNTIGVHVMIGNQIAPNRYPYVIGQMQRNFTPHIWQSTDVQLVHQIPATTPMQWEVVRTFD